MSKKAAPNKTFRLSALAAGIMAANSAWVIVPEAAAACAEQGAGSGIYFCTGTSTRTVSASATNAIGVGTDTSGAGGTLNLEVTATGVIAGVVEPDGFGSGTTFTQTATAAFALDAEDSTLNVTNSGLIAATKTNATTFVSATAIVYDDESTGTVTNNGTIEGLGHGSVSAEAVGVVAEGSSTIVISNSATGEIVGSARGAGEEIFAIGVGVEGAFTEQQVVPGTGGFSYTEEVLIPSEAEITNEGLILGEAMGTATATTAAAWSITAEGVSFEGNGSVDNSGTIKATASGLAEEVVAAGVWVAGDTSFSIIDSDPTGTTQFGSYSESRSKATATITNSGMISGLASGTATGTTSAALVGTGVGTRGDATINNSGMITGKGTGDRATGEGIWIGQDVRSSFSGTQVTSGSPGTRIISRMEDDYEGGGSATITNSGMIMGTGSAPATLASGAAFGIGIQAGGDATITNDGMITGSAVAPAAAGAVGVEVLGTMSTSDTFGSETRIGATVALTNSGDIKGVASATATGSFGDADGIGISVEGVLDLNNSGLVMGKGSGISADGIGIEVEDGFSTSGSPFFEVPGEAVINNAGTIHGSAMSSGTFGASGVGILVDGTAEIVNSGNIKGDASAPTASAAGILVEGTASIVNSSTGSIKGMAAGAAPMGAGVSVIGSDAAAIIENNGGMIVGSEVGVYVESSSTRVGLTSASAPVLDDPTNNGLAAVIINSGTISGMATTGASIKTGGGVTFISNSGMLKGDVLLGGADNIVDLTGGTVDGDVVHTGGFADIAFFGDATITGDVTDVNEVLFESGAGTIVGSVTGAELVDVFSGAVANFINGGTVGGVANAGRMNLTGTLTADSYADSLEDEDNPGVFTSGGQVFFMISSPTEAGQLVAGSVDLTSSTALGATPATGVELAEGAEFHVVDVTTVGGLSSTTPVEDLAVQGGGLYVFRAVLGDSTELTAGNGDADDIFFITDRIALTSLVSGGGDTTTTINESVVAAAAALEEVLASGTTDPILTAFVNEVLPLLDTEEIITVLKEISQTSTVGSVGGAASAAAGGSGAAGGGAGAVGGTDVAMRLEELRLADSMAADSGVNAGDHAMAARGFWIQAGNSKGEQDERDGVDGYDSISESLTLGLDAEVSSGNTAGLAYTYVRSDVSPDGNPGSIDMDTHALTLYGSTKRGIQSIDASFTYSDHAFDSTRGSTVLAGQAVADYDGSTLSLNLGTSWDNQLNKTFSLEPRIGLTWSQTEIDKYTETTTAGATIVPMAVEVDDIDALVARAGIALKAKFKDGPITWAPKLYATVHHDFEGEQPSARVGFAGALPRNSFGSKGAEPEKTLYEAGVGVTAYQTGKLKLTGKYAVSSQDDFDGQSLSFTARWKF